MILRRIAALTTLSVALAAPALAQDDDLLDDDEGALDNIDDKETLDGEDELLDEEIPLGDGMGEDDAVTYRAAQEEVIGLPADEEQMAWEDYLSEYPNSHFQKAIEKRIEELTNAQYSGGGNLDGPTGPVDNDNKRINMAQSLLMENIEPRTRIQAGFEWGLPDYINLMADYERELSDGLSFHVGGRNRYTGWSVEGGVKYSLIKSVRTQTLLTFIGDVHINANPAFFGIRPQLAFGKRLGDVDIQAQFGPDIAPRRVAISDTESRGDLDLRLVGGANVTWQASDTVAIFGEANVHMKGTAWPSFRFNVVSFGLKFYPDAVQKGRMEVNLGTSAPLAPNYWMYHYGSLMGQVNYYAD